MQNITQEKFKKAIRDKYKIEKEGKNFEFLNSPSPAKLRDLCWEIFMSDRSKDDLIVFSNFFGCEFSLENKKKVYDQTDKFRSIGFFFKGKTAETNYMAIDMAAILVDFKPRPFGKFRLTGANQESFNEVVSEEKEEDVIQEEIEITNTSEIEKEYEVEEIIQQPEQKLNLHIGKKNTLFKYVIAISIVALIGLIIYLALPEKQCMQWSQDHYELVDCNLKTEGFAATNPVELLDESLINLKKVEVCDTTRCFDKNGDAIYWYAKTANGIDFFNGHGRHPENNSALRPVTQYILKKYVKKH